jgi:hypothetical protein
MINRANRVRSGLGLLLLLGAGCASKSEDIPLSDFISRAKDAICDRAVRCGSSSDRASCESSSFSMLQDTADVGTGKIIYNGEAAGACLSAIAAGGCNRSDEAGDVSLQKTCDAIATGTVANGGACFNGDECVSRSCNLSSCNSVTCCAGSCQAEVASGGDCTANGTVCADGTFCNFGTTGTTATCMAPVAAGQPCQNGSSLCAPGTICNADPTTGSGTCGTAPAEGQPCPNGICNSAADFCDSTSRTCLHMTAVGGACPSGTQCVPYAICSTTSMTCVALAAAGAACTTSNDCLNGLPCTGGVCVAPSDVPACP